MTKLKTTGVVLCLSISAFLPACGDDDGGGGEPDSGVRPDSGTPLDSGTPGLDAGRDAGSDAALDSATPSGAVTYNIELTKSAEVPVCSDAGASALGEATISVSESGDEIAVAITYAGLSGPATAGHIHYGAAGASGPVALPFSSLTSPIALVLTAANYNPSGTLPATFAAFVSELKAGKAYVNLHTAACAPGEIRGQIVD